MRIFYSLLWWLVALVCFSGATHLSFETYHSFVVNESAKHWPIAEAKIVKVWTENFKIHTNRSFKLKDGKRFHCIYKYAVDGREFESSHISASRDDSRQLRDAKIGDTLTIHYNPKDPSQALASLQDDALFRNAFSIAFFAAFAIIFAGMAMTKIDPVKDIIKGPKRLNELPFKNVRPSAPQEAASEIGSIVKQFVAFMIAVNMIMAAAGIWKVDIQRKNWVAATATVVDSSSPRGFICQFSTDAGKATSIIHTASANKEYPLGSKVEIKYNPVARKKAVLLSSVEAPDATAANQINIVICLIVLISLFAIKPKYLSFGLGSVIQPRTNMS